ncbi:hypothetical protein MSSAC_3171 [Methanosarcina siciliae C2J]|uniref:Lysophospholipase n=1 Tax=Methanosarcina siciliae C2J TaxID=1434118 RepID=A0A0E3LDS1_9EURY|nr:hypothetical protein [Methanosarcina siciliae]AKB37761.1 hypothetical protein MSSAC_3171 [Methanosarcina siciliae C2J]
MEKHLIPYESVYIPALRIPASGNKKSVLVIHGGYDSCMEYFHSVYRYLTKRGYEIIVFEEPSQSAYIQNII